MMHWYGKNKEIERSKAGRLNIAAWRPKSGVQDLLLHNARYSVFEVLLARPSTVNMGIENKDYNPFRG